MTRKKNAINELRAAALDAIRAAWRSGYLAAGVDHYDHVKGDPDGCDAPDDYLQEAIAARTPVKRKPGPDPTKNDAKVRAALASGPLSLSQVAEAAGLTKASALRALRRIGATPEPGPRTSVKGPMGAVYWRIL